MKTVGIIPARYQSSRFPGKPLALIGGKEMLWHVYTNVLESSLFDEVVIATDDDRIRNKAETWGANVIMTSANHLTGTDRCAEVVEKLEASYDIVVNIQGDEPFISNEPLQLLFNSFKLENTDIATLCQPLRSEEELYSPNVVKIARNVQGNALYFSRSVIPFPRNLETGKPLTAQHQYWKHIGLYGFKTSILRDIVKLSPSVLELAESLEQLRWLENGYKIHIAETNYQMIAVDTPEDLEAAEKFYQRKQQNIRI